MSLNDNSIEYITPIIEYPESSRDRETFFNIDINTKVLPSQETGANFRSH